MNQELTDLRGANLSEANLRGANLNSADLRVANLRWADLSGANLSWANLSGANLRGANLSGADLSWANLRWADLSGANLNEADLSWADLSGADLSGANLSGAKINYCIGNMREIKSMQITDWHITYASDPMAIGCEQHPIDDWMKFTDEEIELMDEGALEWWRKWKETIFQIIEMSPATGVILD